MSDRERSKARGCLLGVALGDALGAPYEGSVTPALPDGLPGQTAGVLRYTDDTHMTIGVARSLIDCGGFDGAHMTQVLKRNYQAEPWRGYGSGPPQVFRHIDSGVPWDEAAGLLFEGAGSFGNGAAMRVSPVAIFARGDPALVDELARASAAITHTHELGLEGAALQALAVAWLLERDRDGGFNPVEFVSFLAGRARTDVYRTKVRSALSLLPSAARTEVVSQLGNGIAAAESVPAALYAFLRHPNSFEDAVRYAISLGGDADTIASMTGALSGAYLGEEATPEEWKKRIEGYEEIVALADALVGVRS